MSDETQPLIDEICPLVYDFRSDDTVGSDAVLQMRLNYLNTTNPKSRQAIYDNQIYRIKSDLNLLDALKNNKPLYQFSPIQYTIDIPLGTPQDVIDDIQKKIDARSSPKSCKFPKFRTIDPPSGKTATVINPVPNLEARIAASSYIIGVENPLNKPLPPSNPTSPISDVPVVITAEPPGYSIPPPSLVAVKRSDYVIDNPDSFLSDPLYIFLLILLVVVVVASSYFLYRKYTSPSLSPFTSNIYI
jgi:hypothetical protein